MNDMAGRNDGNMKVVFPAVEIPEAEHSDKLQKIKPGDYVVVQVSSYVPQHM
jgi:S-adenosylmethionine hydrolase